MIYFKDNVSVRCNDCDREWDSAEWMHKTLMDAAQCGWRIWWAINGANCVCPQCQRPQSEQR